VEDPNDIFPLVMKYAEKTGENPWVSLYDVMRYSTALVYEGGIPISYVSGHRNEDGDLFIKTAYADHPFMSTKAFEEICEMLVEEQQSSNTIFISSKLPERLWKRYGFNPYETLYKKIIHKTLSTGGDTNG
jgi:hypothetical protein